MERSIGGADVTLRTLDWTIGPCVPPSLAQQHHPLCRHRTVHLEPHESLTQKQRDAQNWPCLRTSPLGQRYNTFGYRGRLATGLRVREPTKDRRELSPAGSAHTTHHTQQSDAPSATRPQHIHDRTYSGWLKCEANSWKSTGLTSPSQLKSLDSFDELNSEAKRWKSTGSTVPLSS